MPKVSQYELEHIEEESNFEKVRSKKSKSGKEEKSVKKKKHQHRNQQF